MIDTDVLIWYLRGNPKAKRLVEKLIPFSISAVTYMELGQGMKDKAEFRRFQKTLKAWGVRTLHIDQEISSRAIFYVQEYFLGYSMKMADALIAATVVQNSEKLVTANDRYYKFIPNVEIEKFVVE